MNFSHRTTQPKRITTTNECYEVKFGTTPTRSLPITNVTLFFGHSCLRIDNITIKIHCILLKKK